MHACILHDGPGFPRLMVGCAAAHSGASLRGHQLKAKQRKWCLQLGSLRPANIRLLQPRNIIRTSRFLGLTAFLMLLLSFVFFYTLDYSGLSASAGCSVWSGVWNSFLIAIASVVTACSSRFLSYGLFSLVSNFMSPWAFSILFCPSSD